VPRSGRECRRVRLAPLLGLSAGCLVACDRPDAVPSSLDAGRGVADASALIDAAPDARPDRERDATAPAADARPGADLAAGDATAADAAAPPGDAGRGPGDARSTPVDGSAPLADGAVAADALRPPDASRAADAATPPDMGPAPWRLPERARCETGYSAPVDQATLADVALVEASGIVPSPTQDRVLWLHNDSGDASRLFAARTDGVQLGRVFLRDVVARDWEDIAAAPCPDARGPCLYVGDIGNNRHNRRDLAVYVLPEPAVDPERPFGEIFAESFQRYPFRYPLDGNPDSEALVVAPDGSTFYVLEKIDWDQARIWRHPGPLVPDVEVELVELHAFPSQGALSPGGRQITGADLHPSGTRLVIRVYSGVYEYRFDRAGGLDRLDLAEVIEVVRGPASEPQGEAVAYDHAGTGLYTISEDAGGRGGRVLHHYPCRP
jgi:hypothetical protein